MAEGILNGTRVNRVIPDGPRSEFPAFATTNPFKLQEISAGLGIPMDQIRSINLDIDEIQDKNPRTVAIKKAQEAYKEAGEPVYVEDTTLNIYDLSDLLEPTVVKFWAEDRNRRKKICNLLSETDRRAEARTIFAIADGENVATYEGKVYGTIAESPAGSPDFGWDDIFIPDGQKHLQEWEENPVPRTFAQMLPEEKIALSMRQEALEQIKENPFEAGIWVHGLLGTLDMEIEAIDKEYFKGPEMAAARRFAFKLRSLGDMEENEDLHIDPNKRPPIIEVKLHPEITQYTHDPKSKDIGVLLMGYDHRKLADETDTRIKQNQDGRPSFLEHTAKSYTRGIAARAYEFSLHHNPSMYEHLRKMMNGQKTPDRPNIASPVIDQLLGMKEFVTIDPETGEEVIEFKATAVPGFTDLAYERQYSEESQSRTAAAMNHILNRNGVPTSIFALGGMPPVTGSRDVVTTAALSFMRSYIPHNSLFVDFDRRKEMFDECKAYVEEMIEGEENEDIRKLAVAQIGVCVSGKDIEAIAHQTDELIQSGCSSLRIYTTNPGPEVPDAARAIGKMVQEKRDKNETLPFHLCVGPIVNKDQAEELRKISEEYGIALTLLAGHGGGENCTSLEGGAAANAIQIIYALTQKPEFNNVSLGFEGGLGTWFGPWMGRIEQISKDGSMVRGCIETQGGISILHKTGAPVQPYSGTASPWTQMIERTLFPELAPRTNPAGQLKNNEGKPGYMKTPHWAISIANYFYAMRSMLGRTLADQQSSSIDEIIENIKKYGDNHLGASSAAVDTAKAHRPSMS